MAEIFQGIKVADFAWVGVGPFSSQYLAQHGATVVRIESETHPETLRTAAPYKDNKPGINRTGFYARFNVNKFGAGLNLNHPKGPEIAKRFVKWADIVTDSYPPGMMKKWGLNYEELVKIKPDIVMFSSCNQGQTGPYARQPGYGVQLSSLSGFTYLTGWPDRDPAGLYGAYTDFITPQFITASLAAALIRRKRTGRGVYMDFSQFECGAWFIAPLILEWQANKTEQTRMGNRVPYACPNGGFRCKGDDEWVAISVSEGGEWHSLCRAVGETWWAKDARFSTHLGRKESEDELERLIEAWTINLTNKEAMGILQKEGVPAGAVWKNKDVYDDPQLQYRKHFPVINHSEMGPYPTEVSSFIFSKTPSKIERHAPCLGEHSYYVYTQLLGMSDEEFIQLMGEGVFE